MLWPLPWLLGATLVSTDPAWAQDAFSASALGDFDGVSVIEVDGDYDATLGDFRQRRAAVARAFYEDHADDVDFLVVYANFDYALLEYQMAGQTTVAPAFYLHVKNDVQGIGLDLFDHGEAYGSQGRLQGFLDMGHLADSEPNPLSADFERTMTSLSHELLHRWSAYVEFDRDGSPSDELLGVGDLSGLQRSHWSFLFDSAGSVLYGNRWQDNRNGTYTSLPGMKYFGPFDLYLMGLYAPSEVPPGLLIENPAIDRERPSEPYVTIEGTAQSVSIDDVIAVESERLPSHAAAQKTFRVAFVLLTRPGGLVGDETYQVSTIAEHFLLWFSSLTDGRAQLKLGAALPEDLPTNPGPDAPAVEPRSAPPSVEDGLAWLLAAQGEDGSWRADALSAGRDTAVVVQALAVFEDATAARDKGIAWLSAHVSSSADTLARQVEALPGSGQGSARARLELARLQNADGGFGGQPGLPSEVLDSALSLRALDAAGSAEPAVLDAAIAFLLARQRPDGSFGDRAGAGEVRATARALLALAAFRRQRPLDAALAAGLSWLLGVQNPDGGFGPALSTVYDTADALLALLALEADRDAVNRAVAYLFGQQAEDGSFNASAYQTGLAVRALYQATIQADLAVSPAYMAFDPAELSVLPQTVTVSLAVENRGATDVAQTRVALYHGALAEPNRVGEQSVAVPARSSVGLDFTVELTEAREHAFYAVVDPDDEVAEIDERNNTAMKRLQPARTHDFVIAAGDVTVEPATVDLLQPVTIDVRVANRGAQDAFHVPLAVELDTAQGTVHVGSAYLDVPAGGMAEHRFTWLADRAGQNMPLRATADPADAFAEIDEGNNQAGTTLTVLASNEPNLVVDHEDVQASPSPAEQGGDVTLSALVRNNGGVAADGVQVDFYVGVPEQGGVLLGSQTIPSLPAGEGAQVAVDWTGIEQRGQQLITVVVDPADRIPEMDEEDNDAFVLLDVLSRPDLVLASGSIAFVPGAPRRGDPVLVRCSVSNAGEQAASDVVVRVTADGRVLGQPSIARIEGHGSASVEIAYDTQGAPAEVRVEALVDPADAIVEQDERNNRAERVLVIQDADLWLSQRYISPDGDGVQDATRLFFRLEAQQRVQLAVISAYGETVRRFSSGELAQTSGTSVEWDGRSDSGALAADGPYRMQLRDERGAVLAELSVEVDTNRSSLVEAVGTEYLRASNLSCMFRHLSEALWLPDDSGLVAHMSLANPDPADHPTGLYRLSADGQELTRLTPFDWSEGNDPDYDYRYGQLALSPDGERLAFVLEREHRLSGALERLELWQVELADQRLVALDSFDLLAEQVQLSVRGWSTDGARLAYVVERPAADTHELWVIDSSALEKELLVSGAAGGGVAAVWQRHGSALAYTVAAEAGQAQRIWLWRPGQPAEEIYAGVPDAYILWPHTWLDRDVLVAEQYPSRWLLLDATGGGDHHELAHAGGELRVHPLGGLLALLDGTDVVVCTAEGDCAVVYQQGPASDYAWFGELEQLGWSPDGERLVFLDLLFEQIETCRTNGHVVVLEPNGLAVESFAVAEDIDVCGEPGGFDWLKNLGWLADSRSLVGEDERGALLLDLRAEQKLYLPVAKADPWDDLLLSVSPLGRYVSYDQPVDQASVCRGHEDRWALGSLLNLTADIRAGRDDDAVVLSGTAADRNFDRYVIEYADEQSPHSYQPLLPASRVPVVDGVFTRWLPPEPGRYRVRLLVYDLAGNMAEDRVRVSWGLRAPIANPYRAAEVFSPNADGVLDQAELHYTVLEPTHLTFFVRDAQGALVRTLERDHPIPGAGLLVWDGEDESGQVVADGVYRVEVLGHGFDFTVDTTPPLAAIEMGAIGFAWDAQYVPPRQHLVAHLLALALDENLKGWEIAQGLGVNPSEWQPLRSGSTGLQKKHLGQPVLDENGDPLPGETVAYYDEDLEHAVGRTFRIAVEDLAGNKSTRVADMLEEVLVARRCENASGVGHEVALARRADGRFVALGTAPAGLAAPGWHVLQGLETVRLPLVSARAQLRVDAQWIDWSEQVDPLSGTVRLEWDNSDLDPGAVVAVRIRAEDLAGKEIFSNPVPFRDLLHVRAECTATTMGLTAFVDLFEALAWLRVQLRSHVDPTYGQWEDIRLFDAAQGDVVPTGWFHVALPPGLVERASYQVRLLAQGASGQSHESEIGQLVYVADCTDDSEKDFSLRLQVDHLRASGCNQRSLRARLTTVLENPPKNARMESLGYYLKTSGDFELLDSRALAGPRLPELELDTRELPEGVWPLKAVLAYRQDGQQQVREAFGLLVVDQTLPVASLTAPGPYARVCARPYQNDQGDLFEVVEVAAEVDDDSNVRRYALRFGRTGSPARWLQALTPRGCPAGYALCPIEGAGSKNGSIGPWDVTPLGAEDYALRLAVEDVVGNLSCADQPLTIDRKLQLYLLSGARLFSPNADGVLDGFDFSVSVDEPTALDVDVFQLGPSPQDRRHVRTLAAGAPHAGGSLALDWDGADDVDEIVPDGLYEIEARAEDTCGNQQIEILQVEVDNTPPALAVTYPRPGDPLGVLVEVVGTATDQNFAAYQLIERPSGAVLENNGSAVVDGVLGSWNNFGLDGQQTLELRAVDLAGNGGQTSVTVDLTQRGELVSSMSAEPALISPNNDGIQDATEIAYTLTRTCDVALEMLDAAEVVVYTAQAGGLPPGAHAFGWFGVEGSGASLPDGVYQARLGVQQADDPNVQQTQSVHITLDTAVPSIAVESPTEGSCHKETIRVRGTVSDEHLAGYEVAYGPAGGGRQPLDQGGQNRQDYAFGTLSSLDEGSYVLHVHAEDRAGNEVDKHVAFCVDRTPPVVQLTAPEPGELVSGTDGPVLVGARIEEEHLAEYTLRYGAGDDPTEWTGIETGDSLPAEELVFDWPAGPADGLADGRYSLSLLAVDRAGWQTERRLRVELDNTPPTIAVSWPHSGDFVTQVADISGTVSDPHLERYSVSVASGSCEQALAWTQLRTSEEPVENGALATWSLLGPDGATCLRVEAWDQASHRAEQRVAVQVDTKPPPAPVLAGEVRDRQDACLSWAAVDDPGLAGYDVYRNGAKRNSGLLGETVYTDGNLAEGTYRYTVRAVDQAGWESEASNEVELVVDRTGPRVVIRKPKSGDPVGDWVVVQGTAHGDDLAEYRVEVGRGLDPVDWTRIARSTVPQPFGLLARWDAFDAEQGDWTIVLAAEDHRGNASEHRVRVTVDHSAPAAPVLLSAQATGQDVELVWAANAESDLAGYLLYRNHRLVNATGAVVGELTPYLLTGTSYTDSGLVDGEHEYHLLAVDRAGNQSDASNTRSVRIDTRAPRAVIVEPADGQRFASSVLVRARSADRDVAAVQLQLQPPGASAWTDLGTAMTAQPYELVLDPVALSWSYGAYGLRAVATDEGGQTDADPQAITVRYTDVEAPAAPEGLQAVVVDDDLTLSWAAGGEPDLAGYRVYMDIGDDWLLLTDPPVSQPTYVYQDLDDGPYRFRVTALDRYDNESAPSEPVAARVYAPVLVQPYTPVAETEIFLEGSGANPKASVELFVDTGGGAMSAGSTTANDQGGFAFTAALAGGENLFTARVAEPNGNVSRTSEPVTVVSNQAPAKPTGLTATVDGHTVSLSWNANAELDLLGYGIHRDGERLLAHELVSGVQAQASVNSSQASRALDGSQSTYWSSGSMDPQEPEPVWWQADLPALGLVTRVEVDWGDQLVYGQRRLRAAADYELQAWTGTGWLTLVEVEDNGEAHNVLALGPAYAMQTFRLLITRPLRSDFGAHVRLAELRTWQRGRVDLPAYDDQVPADGRYRYRVSAIDRHGAESLLSDELVVEVGDVEPPAAPSGLAAAVSGADVGLSWNDNGEPDLAGYHVYRRAQQDWLRLSGQPVTPAAYVDAALANGGYTYRVTAVDQAGNESQPSSEVLALVDEPLPASPTISSVTAPAPGGSLVVCWQAAAGELAGYRLYRATVSGGPYEPVGDALLIDTCHQDAGLTDGVAYFYVVVAIDVRGNHSAYSNEESGVPADALAPEPPVLFAPTVSSAPIAVEVASADVAGTAEAGASVSLLRNGQPVGQTRAVDAERHSATELLATGTDLRAALSPDGKRLAFSVYDGAFEDLYLQDLELGQIERIASSGFAPRWWPDGTKVLYVHEDASWNLRIRVYDLDTGDTSALTDDADVSESAPSVCRDGSRVALTSDREGSVDVWVRDLGTGQMTRLSQGRYAAGTEISPDCGRVAYLLGDELWVAEVVTREATLIDPNVSGSGALLAYAWAPDSARLAYASSSGGQMDVFVRELTAADPVQVTDTADEEIALDFSSDGTRLVLAVDGPGGVVIRTQGVQAPGQVSTHAELSRLRYLDWAPGAQLAFASDEVLYRVQLPGLFRFPDVLLEVGENRFAATASDAAGNQSEACEPIEVLLDPSRLADLEIRPEDVAALPAAPVEGQTVTLAFAVRNTGNAVVDSFVCEVLVWTASGLVELVDTQRIGPLAAGEVRWFQLAWDSAGRLGENTFYAAADPEDEVVELSEQNNAASKGLYVAAEAGLKLVTRLDATSYGAEQDVHIEVDVHNAGPELTGAFELRIEDAAGDLAERVERIDLALAHGQSWYRAKTWNTGGILPGAYRVRAVLTDEQGQLLAESTSGFVIERQMELAVSVYTDRVRYLPGEDVRLSAELENGNARHGIDGLEVRLRVLDDQATELFVEPHPVPWLWAGDSSRLRSVWNTAASPPGLYHAEAVVVHAGEVLASESKPFEIGSLFSVVGTLEVMPPVVFRGRPVTVEHAVMNQGSQALAGLTVRLALVDPHSMQVLVEREETVDLAVAASHGASQVFDTEALKYRTYRVVLSFAHQTGSSTAAIASFVVKDGFGPRVEVLSPEPEQRFVLPVDISALVKDDGLGVARVDHRIDDGVWIAMGPFDPSRGLYGGAWAPEPGEEGEHTLFVRAVDMVGNPTEVSVPFGVDAVCIAQDETCDARDNDCDGETDEGLGATICGLGVCTNLVANCQDGQPRTCEPRDAATDEVCDALDNDCDGEVDEDLTDCVPCSVDDDCEDDNPCTEQRCIWEDGCRYEMRIGPCDDGDDCTLDDRCQDGVCRGDPRDQDEDGYGTDACGGDDCDDGRADVHPGVVELGLGDPACEDGVDNDCDGQTDADDEGCKPCQKDADCDDGNPCNGAERCAGDRCQAGGPLDCDDDNPCTEDSCDKSQGGCVHSVVLDGTPCDDGDECTEGDRCQAGECVGEDTCDDGCACGRGLPRASWLLLALAVVPVVFLSRRKRPK